MRTFTLFLILAGTVSACRERSAQPAAATPDSAMAPVSPPLSGDWTLVVLHGAPAPVGAGDRPATLSFLAEAGRVGGFAGCNRIAGPYRMAGDSLVFGPLAMTRMACDKGMDLEQQFTAALDSTRRWRQSADTLDFLGADGATAARLVRQPSPTE